MLSERFDPTTIAVKIVNVIPIPTLSSQKAWLVMRSDRKRERKIMRRKRERDKSARE